MNQFICLSPSPWCAVPTRTQHLLSRLHGAEVLFFEPPSGGGSRDHKKPGRKLRPGLTVYTLPPVMEVEERHEYLFQRGQSKLARFIESKLDRHRFRDAVLWTTCPRQVHLLDLIPHRGLVYDCGQFWDGLPESWEANLAFAADVVFAASPSLLEDLLSYNDNVALLPNGVNFPMFSRDGLEPPPELKGLEVPVLGYAGTVWRDLDLSPVLRAARALPRCAFAFVGAVEERNPLLPRLKKLPNVAFLGERPLVDLPDYLGRFDVCLNLLRAHEPWNDIIPPRIYEYLSTGAPVVSMLREDQVEHFPDVIYYAHSDAEFAQLCQTALSEVGSWARSRRRDYGELNSWSRRADEVCRILGTIGLYR